MKRIFFIFVLSMLAFSTVKAQDTQYAYHYSVAFPGSSDFTNFIEETSWAGFNLSIIHFFNDNFGIGGSLGWNDFYQKDIYTTVSAAENVDVTGTFRHNVYFTPVLFNTRYRFRNSTNFEATAGLDFGTYFMYQRSQVSAFYGEESKVKFGFSPSLGGVYKFSYDFGLSFRGRYNAIVGYDNQYVENPSFWGVELGLMWIN